MSVAGSPHTPKGWAVVVKLKLKLAAMLSGVPSRSDTCPAKTVTVHVSLNAKSTSGSMREALRPATDDQGVGIRCSRR